MPIHWLIWDSVEKWFHLWDHSCNYFQNLMSTSLPSVLTGFRQNSTSSCTVQWELEVLTCCFRQTVLTWDQPHQLLQSQRSQELELSWIFLQQWLHNHILFGILRINTMSLSWFIDALSWSRCLGSTVSSENARLQTTNSPDVQLKWLRTKTNF